MESFACLKKQNISFCVLACSMCPNMDLLAILTDEGKVMVFRSIEWQRILNVNLQPGIKACIVEWGSNGRVIVIGTENGSVILVDSERGTLISSTTLHPFPISSLCWVSPSQQTTNTTNTTTTNKIQTKSVKSELTPFINTILSPLPPLTQQQQQIQVKPNKNDNTNTNINTNTTTTIDNNLKSTNIINQPPAPQSLTSEISLLLSVDTNATACLMMCGALVISKFSLYDLVPQIKHEKSGDIIKVSCGILKNDWSKMLFQIICENDIIICEVDCNLISKNISFLHKITILSTSINTLIYHSLQNIQEVSFFLKKLKKNK